MRLQHSEQTGPLCLPSAESQMAQTPGKASSSAADAACCIRALIGPQRDTRLSSRASDAIARSAPHHVAIRRDTKPPLKRARPLSDQHRQSAVRAATLRARE
jgi:hypothetical protein